MRKTAVSPELGTQIREYLEKQGYGVTEGARLVGKSGVEHTFDMLARRDDGFTSYNVAVGIAAGGDRDTEAGTIFTLANKAYDCGILDRILVATPELSAEARELARKQRITVVDGDQIGQLLTAKPQPPVKVDAPLTLDTKEELVKALTDRGYQVKKRIKIKGRSGNDYVFDILARTENGQVEPR
jgi:general secretion pathway protein E